MTDKAQSFTESERQKYIGCSELGAVLGLDPYKSPLDLYNIKLGLVPPFEGNRHTERGKRLEHIAIEMYEEQTGNVTVARDDAFVHPDYPFIVGHVDRVTVPGNWIVEVKCPSNAAYRKMQRQGLPDYMAVQLQGYMGLSGAKIGDFVIFCADQMACDAFNVEFDPIIYEAAIKAATDLWNNHIVPQIPPLPDKNLDGPKLEFAKIGGDTTYRDDESFVEAVTLLREAKDLIKDGKELEELAKARAKDAVEGEFGKYEGGGQRLYYKQCEGRRTLDKKALQAAYPSINLEDFMKQGESYEEIRLYSVTGE